MINCTIIGKFDSPSHSASPEHWDNSQLRVSSEIIESQISLENVRRRPSCHNKSLDFSCILIASYTLSSTQNYGWFTSIRRRSALRREGTWFGALLQGIRPHQGHPDQERLRIRGKHRIIIIIISPDCVSVCIVSRYQQRQSDKEQCVKNDWRKKTKATNAYFSFRRNSKTIVTLTMLFTSWTGRSCWVKGRIRANPPTFTWINRLPCSFILLLQLVRFWTGLVRLQRVQEEEEFVNRKADFPYKASLMSVNVSSSDHRPDKHAQQLVLLFNDSLEVCKSAWAALNFHFNVIIRQLSANALLIFQVPRVGIICLPGRCWFTPLIFSELCQIWDGRWYLSAVVIILVLSSHPTEWSSNRLEAKSEAVVAVEIGIVVEMTGAVVVEAVAMATMTSKGNYWSFLSRGELYSDDALSPFAGTLRGMDPRCAPSTVWRSRICPAELVGR